MVKAVTEFTCAGHSLGMEGRLALGTVAYGKEGRYNVENNA